MPKRDDNKIEKKKKMIILFVFLFLIIVFITYYAVSFSFNNGVGTKEIEITIPKKKTIEPETKKKKTNKIYDFFIGDKVINKKIKKTSNKKEEIKNIDNNQSPNEEEKELDPGIFAVRDSEEKWDTNTELKIFEKTSNRFIAVGKIAPGIHSTYKFVVKNNNDFNITYNITFEEENIDNINMLYKVQCSNDYLFNNENNWININNKKITNKELNSNKKDEYILTWKWFEGSNDTAIGLSGNIHYKLSIVVEAEEIV